MSQCDTMNTLGRRGLDGLAQIGPTRFDIAGIRFAEGEQNAGADADADADKQDDEQGSDADAQDADGEKEDDEEGFDGDFDAKRARRTIDRLRRERNTARDAAKKDFYTRLWNAE